MIWDELRPSVELMGGGTTVVEETVELPHLPAVRAIYSMGEDSV
jgi:hypothetical protein